MEPMPQSLKRSHLPVYLTRFVGRELEQATLNSSLLNKRLLTLIGAGGIGKTRLALHVATESATSFADGVYLVELASLTESQLVLQTIASALDLRTDQERSLSSVLIATLQDRHCLLLLDNCEHVLAVCASLVDTLLQACPHLHVLATSREPFHITGETLWRVAALSSPDPEQLPPFEQISHYEAIQLFCERATDSDPRFQLTPQNAPAIVRICHQLDGLPLALERYKEKCHMSVDRFRGRKLELNDVVIYRCSVPAPVNADAPRQHKENGPYSGKIVNFTNMSIYVRSDGVRGKEPLYHISLSDVIQVESSSDPNG